MVRCGSEQILQLTMQQRVSVCKQAKFAPTWHRSTLHSYSSRHEISSLVLCDPNLKGVHKAVSAHAASLTKTADWRRLEATLAASAAASASSQTQSYSSSRANSGNPWGFALRQPARRTEAAADGPSQQDSKQHQQARPNKPGPDLQSCWNWPHVEQFVVLGLGPIMPLVGQTSNSNAGADRPVRVQQLMPCTCAKLQHRGLTSRFIVSTILTPSLCIIVHNHTTMHLPHLHLAPTALPMHLQHSTTTGCPG